MIGSYFGWQFIEAPKKIIFIFQKTIAYLYHQFSIDFLMRTLFLPWKKDISKIVNPSLQERLNMFAINIISRFMGVLIRSLTIMAGYIIIILSIIAFIIIFITWLSLPFLIIYLIYRGLII